MSGAVPGEAIFTLVAGLVALLMWVAIGARFADNMDDFWRKRGHGKALARAARDRTDRLAAGATRTARRIPPWAWATAAIVVAILGAAVYLGAVLRDVV